MTASHAVPEPKNNAFLPNLCSTQALFLLVLLAELLALLLTLAATGLRHFNWDYLALVSLYILWTVLVCALCLCRLRHWLAKRSQAQAGALSFLLVLAVTLVLSIFSQWYMYPIDSDTLFKPFRLDSWLLLEQLALAAIIGGVALRYLYLQQQLINQREAELQARIQALQSRIRPHFLFNSMNSIASLISIDPNTAERLVEDLSELFRASLAEPSLTPLARELDLCRHYLAIEQLRLGERLKVDWQLGEFDPQLKIPSLILQPLLENAIVHGVEPLPKGGTITIKLQQTKHQLRLQITNPYPLEKLAHSTGNSKMANRHNHMALGNIRHRLVAHYGSSARLSSSAEQGVYSTYIFCPLKG